MIRSVLHTAAALPARAVLACPEHSAELCLVQELSFEAVCRQFQLHADVYVGGATCCCRRGPLPDRVVGGEVPFGYLDLARGALAKAVGIARAMPERLAMGFSVRNKVTDDFIEIGDLRTEQLIQLNPAFDPGQAMELFPNAPADPPRRLLDRLFHAAADLRHVGAHGEEPRVFVHSGAAELVLTTVPLFRHVGQCFERASMGR